MKQSGRQLDAPSCQASGLMSELAGGSYLTVKIGIISVIIPALLSLMGAALWLSLVAQWVLAFVLWHCVWDHVYPAKPDAKPGKLSLKKPHSLFLIHVVATVMTPYLPLLVGASYGIGQVWN